MQLDIPPTEGKTFCIKIILSIWTHIMEYSTKSPTNSTNNEIQRDTQNLSIQEGIQINASFLSASHNGNISWGAISNL